MRKLLTFEVSGVNEQELEEKALNLYRQFLDNDDATLPHNAVIDAKPEYEVRTGDGESTMVRWSATVTVTYTESPY